MGGILAPPPALIMARRKDPMLFDPARHEPLNAAPWDEGRARECIDWIVRGTLRAMTPEGLWATHPQDASSPEPEYMLYCGAAGVAWALHYLQAQGFARLEEGFGSRIEAWVEPNRRALEQPAGQRFGAYLMGDTSLRMLQYQEAPSDALAGEIDALVAANVDHPARELMWGSPGTLLAALFMHRRTGEARWARHFVETAARLRSQLQWSDAHACHYWTQDMYGQHSTYLDAVHGFVATAVPLVQGRHLLAPADWEAWAQIIAGTVRRTAERDGALANWRALLDRPPGQPKLMQYCHGAPGFVICLGDFPGTALDDLLAAGAEATWAAGPLRKGSNLCHGTGGNGYAFLKLYRRTGDAKWLQRARAFAMHGIAQAESAAREHGQLRHSLWTGDPGLAIYLMDCIRGTDRFPTLDVFFG